MLPPIGADWTRDYLARAFEHKTMKDASTRAENAVYEPSVSPQVVAKLLSVALAFRDCNGA